MIIKKRGGRTYLLHGVTGSGKTEVYMELIDRVIREKKQAIVLIPEIALTFQTVGRFYERFGERVSVMHSRLSDGERYDQYLRAREGKTDVMIGPRSALFTPFLHIGIIIIDEEHESSYKSENVPRYDARETAIRRAGMCGAFVVLGSATPSTDSYYRARSGEYGYYRLPERIGDASLPQVTIVDLREELRAGNRSIFSRKLREAMEDRLKKTPADHAFPEPERTGGICILPLLRKGHPVSALRCGAVSARGRKAEVSLLRI